MASKKTWDKLTSTEKNILIEAEHEARLYQRELNRAQMTKSLDFITAKMTVNEIDSAEMERIRNAAKPVIEKSTAKVGPEVVAAFNAAIAQVRGQ